MQKLKKPILLETAFGSYSAEELIGEGGAGRVYGGRATDNALVAMKVLPQDKASTDQRRRFKNEIAFLARNKHPNIVAVMDHGVAADAAISGPFYVMRRYDRNLRERMAVGIKPEEVLPLFVQVLDGVEAAHMQGVVHRDLKPENILYDEASKSLAVADFGIASFTDDLLVTLVETRDAQRLANFQYASPEQRTRGGSVGVTADIYSLGLMLNEMFTGVVPLGTEPRTIGQAAKRFEFLDAIVVQMLRQNPAERPGSVADLKRLFQKHQLEFISLQKINKIDGTVIPATQVDEPLALEPPRLVGILDWNGRRLTLQLDRRVTPEWIHALQRMPSHSEVIGRGPAAFTFEGDRAMIEATKHEIQQIVDHFKSWLPMASRTMKALSEKSAERAEVQRKEALRRERVAEEERLSVLRTTKI
jgi:serine/threonine protein kinase